ncbi:hypothetical protein [Anaeromyxobacter sp. SG66]|uniref:hypothetical protein n=1 Tax=Anaeromyxobacter sp. SG66 TaxID=2925410 RepID=UPI001F58F830|nr:hypothetical protein [Anaeromyxobacter sp. SG66]
MSDATDEHDRLMRKLLRRARRRQHDHDWIVTLDADVVTIRHRRAPFRAILHGLDLASRERLVAARNDDEVDAALPPGGDEALLVGMRRFLGIDDD